MSDHILGLEEEEQKKETERKRIRALNTTFVNKVKQYKLFLYYVEEECQKQLTQPSQTSKNPTTKPA